MTTSPQGRANSIEVAAHDKRLELLYAEAGDVVVHFWEWRHKIILFCSTILALVFAATTWMYKEGLGGVAMFFPLLVGGAFTGGCVAFDRRNGQIMKVCYDTAEQLEDLILRPSTTPDGEPLGVYAAIKKSRETTDYQPQRGTYGWVLRKGYQMLSAFLYVCAAAALVLGFAKPGLLEP